MGDLHDDKPYAYQEAEGGRQMQVDVAYTVKDDGTANASRYLLDASPRSEAERSFSRQGSSALRDERRGAKRRRESGGIAEAYVYGFRVGDYDASKPLVLDPAVLLYCGYIGGGANDYGQGIAVDGSGNAYVTGHTYSTPASFPAIGGPFLTYSGAQDAFVAKVNPSGSALVYCGYIGGSGDDLGWSIAVDGSGCAYVAGKTSSTEATFPVAVGPYLTYDDTVGPGDAFVAKVSADGTTLVYCGYIGGQDTD